MDAHMSYESSSSKSADAEESKGRVQLPLAEQHYTEGIRRLQLSKAAYEEEHFGKVLCEVVTVWLCYYHTLLSLQSKPKKKGLAGLFSSKNKKKKKVTFM